MDGSRNGSTETVKKVRSATSAGIGRLGKTVSGMNVQTYLAISVKMVPVLAMSFE